MNISLNTANPDDDGYIYLYHYTKAEFLEDILTKRRLKASFIGRSNDPMENLPSFKCDNLGFREDILSTIKTKSFWQKMCLDKPPVIVCLSATCSSVLMWGHYANGHTGACLVFRFKTFPSRHAMMLPIEYSDKMIQVKDYLISCQNNKIFNYGRLRMDLASHKPREWDYEREFRLFIQEKKHLVYENGSYYTNILSNYLCGVILGANCPLSIDEVTALSSKMKSHHSTARSNKKSKLRIIRASFSEDDYSIMTPSYFDLSDTAYKRLIIRFQELMKNSEIGWACYNLTTNLPILMQIMNNNSGTSDVSRPQFYITDRSPFTIMNISYLDNVTSEIDSTLKTE